MHSTRREGDGWRLPARELERTIIGALAIFLRDQTPLIADLNLPEVRPDQLQGVLTKAEALAQKISIASPSEQQNLIRQIIGRIEVTAGELRLQLDRSRLASLLGSEAASECRSGEIDMTVPVTLRRRGVEAKLVISNGIASSQKAPDNSIIQLIATAHEWLHGLSSGRHRSVGEIATRTNRDPGDVSRILSLAFLAPDIIEAILDGRKPPELTSRKLSRTRSLPHAWDDQRQALDFSAPAIG